VLNRYGRRVKALTGGVQKVWIGTTIDECFKKWFDKHELKEVREVPCALCWGVWLARNSTIFKSCLGLVL